MENKKKTFFNLIIAMFFALFFIFSNGAEVSADGWAGFGEAVGGGGGSGGSCNTVTGGKGWMIDCVGTSWIFYKATSTTSSATTLPYSSDAGTVRINGYDAYIPKECSEHLGQNGGFWSYGQNAAPVGYYGDYSLGVTGKRDSLTGSKHSKVFYGHWRPLVWPGHSGSYNTSIVNGSPKQQIGVYTFDRVGSTSTVLNDYNKYLRSEGRSAVSSLPEGLYGFCYWDDMDVKEVTLTAYAVTDYRDSDGAHKFLKTDGTVSDWSTSAPSGAYKVSTTVDSGSSATVNMSINFTGYSWRAWGSSCSSPNGRKCTDSSLTSNKNVYAYYTRNAFSGRASVAEGTDWSSTTNRALTGWKTDDGSVSIDLNCPNGGCKANFWLELRTDAGSGSTAYWTGTQNNGGTISWWPSSTVSAPITPAKSPSYTTVLGTDSNTGAPVDLKPGDSTCRHLEFYPYGSSGNTTYKHLYACARAKETTFQGKTSVSGTNAGTNTTNWQNTNNSQVARITGCSATSGCKVTFTHDMKITNAGGGSSDWTVTRSSNLITTTRGISTNRGSSASSGTFSNTAANGVQVSNSGELTLWPGMVVCERLTFKPSNKPGTGNVYTQVCASAEGDAQPPDPDGDVPEDPPSDPGDPDDPYNPNDPNYLSGDTSFINIKVRNKNVAAYNKFQRSVYAKPGDTTTYRASYNPVLQYTYYLKPQQMRINGGTIYPASGVNTSSTLAAMFNLYKPTNLQNWNNGFNVYSSNFTTAAYNQGHTYTRGDMSKRAEYNNHIVMASEVGRSLNETARTNNSVATQTTPGQVSFTNNSNNNLGNVSTAARQKVASVLVPYNYVNSTEVTRDESDPLYAGETASIAFNITTSPKRNNVTDGTYATIVHNAKWKLEISYYDPLEGRVVSVETTNKTGNLNGNYKLDGDTSKKAIGINIPDVPAGTDICIRSAVNPANSGADTNWNNKDGSGTWAYSGQKCFKVAKRPNMQVWGGNTYSRGSIDMNDAIKNNLAHYTGYQIEGSTSQNYVFGSWTELGLVSSGRVKGLSSGVSLGYTQNNNGDLWPGYHPADGNGNNQSIGGRAPGGSNKKSLCDRSPLTFANTCKSGYVGSLGSVTAANSANDDKSAIISKFIFGGEANIADANNVTLNSDANKREGVNIYYYNGGSEKLTVAGNIVNKGTIQVVHTKNDIAIGGNLEYQDGYATLEDIPKLVIYAEKEGTRGGTIKIGCGVTRIDAVLIADSVLTCDNLGGDNGRINDANIQAKINDQINSNQLKINGAVITGKLYPNRTYGAATGANSMIPAEIINFDPTLYTWGTTTNSEAASGDSAGSSNLDITYQKELAPRL